MLRAAVCSDTAAGTHVRRLAFEHVMTESNLLCQYHVDWFMTLHAKWYACSSF